MERRRAKMGLNKFEELIRDGVALLIRRDEILMPDPGQNRTKLKVVGESVQLLSGPTQSQANPRTQKPRGFNDEPDSIPF
jgi:hypothetical protein